MPRGDGRGPAGLGSMTGRAAGFCAGNSAPGYTAGGFFGRGIGRGAGLGRGRGFRNRFFEAGTPFWARSNYQPESFTKEDELNILKNRTKFMQDEMNAVNERINELENEALQKK